MKFFIRESTFFRIGKYKNGYSQGHWDPLGGVSIDSLTCIRALQFNKNDS
jgi:hypothetical protein